MPTEPSTASGCIRIFGKRCQATATRGPWTQSAAAGPPRPPDFAPWKQETSLKISLKMGCPFQLVLLFHFSGSLFYTFLLSDLMLLTSPNSGEACRTLFPPRFRRSTSSTTGIFIGPSVFRTASASSNANWSPTHFRLREDLPWFAKGPLIRSFHMVSKCGFIMFYYHYLPPRIKSSDSWMLWH